MKVFNNEAERAVIIMPAIIAAVLISDLFLGEKGAEQTIDWTATLMTTVVLFVPWIIISFAMPRLIISSTAIQLKALWGMRLVETILYDEIEKISVQTIALNAQIFVDLKSHKRKIIQGFKIDQAQQILQALQPYVLVEHQPKKIELPLGLSEDIGKRALGIAFLSMMIVLLDLSPSYFHQAWHSSSENVFHWLLISIPLAIVLIYPYIKAEKKAHALLSSIVVGLLFGSALNFLFLQSLRWWNEQHPMPTQVLAFTLLEKEQHRQKWQPVAGNPLDFHDGYVWVYDVWEKGFNPNLKQGQTYRIAVVQGRLNDIYFPVDAFHQAQTTPSP